MDLPYKMDNQTLTIAFGGHIDAGTAPDVERAACAIVNEQKPKSLVLDCDDLSYLSSAGIRVVLRLAKIVGNISLINVASEVYEVLDMCGLTMMLDVNKAFRRISVEGCPIIGQGAKGVLYRIDPETVCKVFRDPDSLPEISRERELARAAFVAGIPTAIPYDVVRVGDGYGSVFELLDADSLGEKLSSGKWSVERVASESAELLRQMADTLVDPEIMPSALNEATVWVDDAAVVLPAEQVARIRELFAAVPDETRMVHGDFHVNNVMVQGDEPLLIDMDTLSHGNPIFDLATAFSAYVGRGIVSRTSVENFLHVSYETSCRLWDLILDEYLPNATAEERKAIEDKVRLVSAVRLIGHPVRHHDTESPKAKEVFASYGAIIAELLPKVDSIAV